MRGKFEMKSNHAKKGREISYNSNTYNTKAVKESTSMIRAN